MKPTVVFLSVLAALSVSVAGQSGNDAAYVGCYYDSFSKVEGFGVYKTNITLAECVEKCIGMGTDYAGIIEIEEVCYCGDDIKAQSLRVHPLLCSVKCRDNANLDCGDDGFMALYDVSSHAARKKFQFNFLVATGTEVVMYNSTSGAHQVLATYKRGSVCLDYHFSKNLLFVFSNGHLYRTRLTVKDNPPLLTEGMEVMKVSRCYRQLFSVFTVDWVHDRLYWPDCSGLKSMDLEGNNFKTVFTPGMFSSITIVRRLVMDPYVGTLFWTVEHEILSCGLEGDHFKSVVKRDLISHWITLDITTSRLFFIQSDTLWSVNYDGSTLKEYVRDRRFNFVWGLNIFRKQAYWVNYNLLDVLYTVSLKQSSSTQIQTVTVLPEMVFHMTLVDPELQRQPSGEAVRPVVLTRPSTSTTSPGTRTPEMTSVHHRQCKPGSGGQCVNTAPGKDHGRGTLVVAGIVLLVCAGLVCAGLVFWRRRRTLLPSLTMAYASMKSNTGSNSDLTTL